MRIYLYRKSSCEGVFSGGSAAEGSFAKDLLRNRRKTSQKRSLWDLKEGA